MELYMTNLLRTSLTLKSKSMYSTMKGDTSILLT